MKRIILITAFAAFSIATNAQSKKDATVQNAMGVPVFVMCEPMHEYEITGKVTDDDAESWLNAASGTTTYRTISESCNVIVNNALRKKKKGKLDFDAIVISNDGHSGTCIKWKIEKETNETK
jgi:hypothetical protein